MICRGGAGLVEACGADDRMAVAREKTGENLQGGLVVLHHQETHGRADPSGMNLLIITIETEGRLVFRSNLGGELDGKDGAFAGAGAFRADRAPVHIDNGARDGEAQSQPETGLSGRQASAGLFEGLKDLLDRIGVEPDSIVAD
jgi:hypothetical protein